MRERLQRGGPRPADDVADGKAVVDLGLHRLVELDVALEDGAIRERQPQPRRVVVRLRADLDEPAGEQPIDQSAVLVDEVEPAVVGEAHVGQLDPLGVEQSEGANRGVRQSRRRGAWPDARRCG